jgi:hypothetical protein
MKPEPKKKGGELVRMNTSLPKPLKPAKFTLRGTGVKPTVTGEDVAPITLEAVMKRPERLLENPDQHTVGKIVGLWAVGKTVREGPSKEEAVTRTVYDKNSTLYILRSHEVPQSDIFGRLGKWGFEAHSGSVSPAFYNVGISRRDRKRLLAGVMTKQTANEKVPIIRVSKIAISHGESNVCDFALLRDKGGVRLIQVPSYVFGDNDMVMNVAHNLVLHHLRESGNTEDIIMKIPHSAKETFKAMGLEELNVDEPDKKFAKKFATVVLRKGSNVPMPACKKVLIE